MEHWWWRNHKHTERSNFTTHLCSHYVMIEFTMLSLSEPKFTYHKYKMSLYESVTLCSGFSYSPQSNIFAPNIIRLQQSLECFSQWSIRTKMLSLKTLKSNNSLELKGYLKIKSYESFLSWKVVPMRPTFNNQTSQHKDQNYPYPQIQQNVDLFMILKIHNKGKNIEAMINK